MIDRVAVNQCSICRACSDICPTGAINYTKAYLDFYYPEINTDKCINCNACDLICPVLNPVKIENQPLMLGYAAKNLNEQIRLRSTSGGVFAAAAEKILLRGGYICGTVMDESFRVYHIVTNSIDDIRRMSGSKYAQSNPEGCYLKIKALLSDGKPVLFCGCPCQVAALNKILDGTYENLISLELVCHGIPSEIMFQSYIKLLEDKYGSKIVNFAFREKSRGWHSSSVRVEFEDGQIYSEPITVDAYMAGYFGGITLKECCYACSFRKFSSGCDLTLGDLWGAELTHKDMDDNKGLSGVIVSSEKGREFLESLSDKLEIRPCDAESIIKYNRNILISTEKSEHRESFYNYVEEHGREAAINDLLWEKKGDCVKRLIKGKLRKLYRTILGKENPLY